MTVSIRQESMNSTFDKFHLDGIPGTPVIHRFTDIDHGDPHDHPWGFTSFILAGGYTEQIFDRITGSSHNMNRNTGQSFFVPAYRVHRIVRLFEGECWTIVIPGKWEQKSGFWQFRDDGRYRRDWDGDWVKL